MSRQVYVTHGKEWTTDVFDYDNSGQLTSAQLNGVITYYVYDGEKPILEYKSTGAMAGNNVYGKGIDEILMRGDYVILPQGHGYFYQQDGNGNVTHLTSFQGTVIEQYKYDAFGQPTTAYSGGVFNNRFKFTGREWAERFGFYEYRARAYHPTLGRFMSEDPSGFAGGDYNLFGYCGNDPLNEVDPMGLQAGHIRLRPPPSGYEMDDGFLGKKIAQARAETDSTMAWGTREGGKDYRRFPSEKAAGEFSARAGYKRTHGGDTQQMEYSQQVSTSRDGSHAILLEAEPVRGSKGTVRGVYQNYSSFPKEDPSPEGYRRTAFAYSHKNPIRTVPLGDRREFYRAGLNAYLAVPAYPGTRMNSPQILFYDHRVNPDRP